MAFALEFSLIVLTVAKIISCLLFLSLYFGADTPCLLIFRVASYSYKIPCGVGIAIRVLQLTEAWKGRENKVQEMNRKQKGKSPRSIGHSGSEPRPEARATHTMPIAKPPGVSLHGDLFWLLRVLCSLSHFRRFHSSELLKICPHVVKL